MHFWWNWPSAVVELLSGLLLAALIATGSRWRSRLTWLLVATTISLAYELVIDCNGWSLLDVAWRELGIVAVLLAWPRATW